MLSMSDKRYAAETATNASSKYKDHGHSSYIYFKKNNEELYAFKFVSPQIKEEEKTKSHARTKFMGHFFESFLYLLPMREPKGSVRI